jgi:CheY-like chemotaxis protein
MKRLRAGWPKLLSLQKLEYEVITAVNGKEALEIYATDRGQIHLVLLDMIIPVMGGEETLRRLLQMRSYAGCSNERFPRARSQTALWPGIADFIQKPFTTGQLGAKITAAQRANVTEDMAGS